MPFGKREAKVEELVFDHFDKVEESLKLFLETVDLYLKGDPGFALVSNKVHQVEDDADELRRQIAIELYRGAYAPVFREDYQVLAERVDNVANKAETVTGDLVLEKPKIPEALHGEVRKLAETTVSAFGALRHGLVALYEDMKNVAGHAHEVSRLEGEVDEMEWDILSQLFEMDIELAQKIHVRDTIRAIGSIADRMENAADRMALMVVKRQF
ncbi:MAG: DUF47 domain-containing protein [Planctomycetota bacterium]|jgi:predicted phosphate transport protein (TIGR00153 family)